MLQLRQRRQPHRLGACALSATQEHRGYCLAQIILQASKRRGAPPSLLLTSRTKSRRNTADTAAGNSGDFASDSNSFTTAVLQGRKDASRVSFCMPASLSLNAPILHSYYRLSSSAKRPSCRQPALASGRPPPPVCPLLRLSFAAPYAVQRAHSVSTSRVRINNRLADADPRSVSFVRGAPSGHRRSVRATLAMTADRADGVRPLRPSEHKILARKSSALLKSSSSASALLTTTEAEAEDTTPTVDSQQHS